MSQLVFLIIAVVVTTVAASGNTLEKTECPSQSFLNRIESGLNNLTSQFSSCSVSSTESSLTGITSLLQLSLLKELLAEYKKESTGNDNEEGLAILQRMELLLNASLFSINERLDSIESEMKSSIRSAEFAMSQNMQSMETRVLSAVQMNSQLLLSHNNMTLTILDELDEKLNPEDLVKSSLPQSCAEVLKNSSNSPSGYYNLADPSGHSQSVYCYMDNLCNAGGGWKRVAKLDMTNSNENCPTGLRLYHQDGGRACGRLVSDSGSCSGTIFPVNYEYSQVCGKVIGYQKGFPDGPYSNDSVILTHGTSQSHIWLFLASASEGYSNCPCYYIYYYHYSD
uniref:Fibrinogen C-terminal domain-containing protein n=1 Tax=Amphimedon queenslandica TaxID=400682 RepID=A0A1X7VN26_AMPQE